jgi:hypothetical protein
MKPSLENLVFYGILAAAVVYLVVRQIRWRRKAAADQADQDTPEAVVGTFILELLSLAISFAVGFGMMIWSGLALFALPNVASHLLAHCGALAGMRAFPLWLNAAGIVVGLGLSWILERFHHNLFMINLCGTRLYGRSPQMQDYIATKWLTALGVPILPVRSYLVTSQIFGRDRQAYAMTPLPQMDWGQVRETFRQARKGYLIAALIAVGITLLLNLMCL